MLLTFFKNLASSNPIATLFSGQVDYCHSDKNYLFDIYSHTASKYMMLRENLN